MTNGAASPQPQKKRKDSERPRNDRLPEKKESPPDAPLVPFEDEEGEIDHPTRAPEWPLPDWPGGIKEK